MNPRIVLITGGSRGIGAAVAEAFAKSGDIVAITGRSDRESLNRTVERLTSIQSQSSGELVDVRDHSAVKDWVARVLARHGRIDVAVANAGTIRPSSFLEITEQQWDEVIDTHLRGTFNVLQAAARAMVERNTPGSLITVSAPSALRGAAGVADYASAKGGIIAMTRCLAKELGAQRIRVNSVCPTADTRMTEMMIAYRALTRETWNKRYLGGRTPTAQEIAGVFLFLASDEARYVTGQVLTVDDGSSL